MTPPPTLDIEELERLEKAATPGPWYRSGSPWYNSGSLVIAGSEDGNIAATVADLDLLGAREEYEGPFKLVDPDDDAALIASLRNAAPALIAAARENAEQRTRGELVEALNEQAEAQRETIAHLREALKAAGAGMRLLAGSCYDRCERHGCRAQVATGPGYNDCPHRAARDCLALIRSGLGTEGEATNTNR